MITRKQSARSRRQGRGTTKSRRSTTSSSRAPWSPGQIEDLDKNFNDLFQTLANYEGQLKLSDISRRRLDHKRLLDMLIDDVEDKYIDLLEGTRSHTANIDAYIKRIATALDDDFNTQFYYPAFTEIRRASRFHDVQLGKIETTNVLANNRGFGKVEPQATMEFDLPKRDILINEALNGALAMTKDFGALVNDPTFLSMAKLRSGQPTSSLTPGAGEGVNTVRNALPGLSRADDEQLFSQQGAGRTQFGSAMEALIPDPAVYKFETGTGFEIRPVVQPDGQSVVFHFNYMYTTNVREPVRADEKHLGRVKRHFIDTDVQLGNYELREVSRYQVALKASRTSRGVPLFEDIPGVGVLFRPLPSAESGASREHRAGPEHHLPDPVRPDGPAVGAGRRRPRHAATPQQRLHRPRPLPRHPEPRLRHLQRPGRRLPPDPPFRAPLRPLPEPGVDHGRPSQRLSRLRPELSNHPHARRLRSDPDEPRVRRDPQRIATRPAPHVRPAPADRDRGGSRAARRRDPGRGDRGRRAAARRRSRRVSASDRPSPAVRGTAAVPRGRGDQPGSGSPGSGSSGSGSPGRAGVERAGGDQLAAVGARHVVDLAAKGPRGRTGVVRRAAADPEGSAEASNSVLADARRQQIMTAICVPGSNRKVGAMRIFRRTFFATAAMQITAAARAAGIGSRRGISRFRTQPKVVCGLPPDRDYVHGGASGPALAVSTTALMLPVRDAADDGVLPSGQRAYYYQMSQAELRVDHCAISRVALVIRTDGFWKLSLRADQNRRDDRDPTLIAVGRPVVTETTALAPSRVILPGATATSRFSEHIKRNLFIVRVRGYAVYTTETSLDAPRRGPFCSTSPLSRSGSRGKSRSSGRFKTSRARSPSSPDRSTASRSS